MRFALFKEVPKRQRRKKRKLNTGGAARKGDDGDSDDDSGDESGDDLPAPERLSMPGSPAAGAGAQDNSIPVNHAMQDPIWGDDSQIRDVPMDVEPSSAPVGPADDGSIRPERFVLYGSSQHICNRLDVLSSRLQLFRTRLSNLFKTRLQDDEQFFLSDLVTVINEGLSTDALFGTGEATQACQAMEANEELMISEGIVYKI